MNTKLLTALILLTATAYAETHSTLTARHRESEGIGYGQGYSTLDYYLTTQMNKLECLLNLRGHLFNNAKAAGNAGLGFRYSLNEDASRIGANVYYDFRDTKHFFASQIGTGLEWLSKSVDLRLNGYLPVGKQKNFQSHRFQTFTGNTILNREKFTAALPCIEGEIGTQLANPFYFAVGSYYLFRETSHHLHVGQALGVKARFDVDIGEYFSAGAFVSYDSLYKTRAQGYVALNIPLGPWKSMKDVTCQYEKRRIVRNEIIPLKSKKTSRTPFTNGRNETTQIVFVNNLAAPLGDGTFERPFNTLKAAEAHSKPGDVIYVFPGDGTANGMTEGIILKDDQVLASSSADLKLDGIVIPAQTPGEIPAITNTHKDEPAIKNPGKTDIKDFYYMTPWEYYNSIDAPSYAYDAPTNTSFSPSPYSAPLLSDWVILGHGPMNVSNMSGSPEIISDYTGAGRK